MPENTSKEKDTVPCYTSKCDGVVDFDGELVFCEKCLQERRAQKTTENFEQYQTSATPNELAELTHLAEHYDDERAKLASMREEVTAQQSVVDRMKWKTIPDQMRLCRQKKITTDTGQVIEVSPTYTCKIREGMAEAAIKWAQENGEAANVKHLVGRAFGMKENEQAEALIARLREDGGEVLVDRKIESSTLKRIYRERSEEGLGMPKEIFETSIKQQASIK